ncbi:MAG TPA: protein tyrosine phosphatase, partial [Isosphaeraceae bacterium]|nr:protein tyrosine phosphatase [Isosphaeraceae bacterium]
TATPWPTFDGWHGLNWRAIGDPSTPRALRALLVGSALAVATWVLLWTALAWRRREVSLSGARSKGILGLLIVAAVLILARIAEFPDVEPFGYWPRWAFDWGLLAFSLALLQSIPRETKPRTRLRLTLGALGAWAVLVGGGLWLVWYHRPLERLHTVVPGKIYISAMPTRDGLDVAQKRHHFKTIINVFNEDTHERSPILPDELAWVEEHGVQYLGSPSDPLEGDAFLNRTLELAQDPDAWPILLHCHGCMDRSVAWMGIYRFVVQKRPLDEILREMEAHRGLRPKASVTLLYNRVLKPRAPEHYAADPSAPILRAAAEGCHDPYEDEIRRALAERQKQSPDEPRLSRRPVETSRP